MKFQNPSLKMFLNGRKNGRTDAQAESNMLPTFSKLGGIKMAHNNPNRYLINIYELTNFELNSDYSFSRY